MTITTKRLEKETNIRLKKRVPHTMEQKSPKTIR